MSSSDPISCNRQPFLSDKECDRGNVDIHQFDDFPYCESFSPTLPEIPPEIVDTPLNIPIPPACACFSIDYAMKLKYNQNRKFAAAAEFSAKGDCCEGQYVTNLDLEIPCPIIGNGSSKRIKMKLGYGNGNKSADVSYIRTDKDSCTVEAKDVDINLNLPCPIKDPGTRKVKIGISYGAKFKGASAKVVEPNATNCTIEPLSPTFNINIPCPIKAPTGRKIKIGISYGKTFRSASASFIKANSVNCTIEALSPSFRLNIPCPIVGREETYNKIRAKIKWGSTKSFSASYIRTNVVDCTLEPKDVNIDLQLRCPIHNAQNAPKIKARIGYGNSGRSASVSFLTADSKNCEIQGKDVNLDLRIPCPVRRTAGQEAPKIRASIRWGSSAQSISAIFLNTDPESCALNANDVNLNLQIPCPIKRNQEGQNKRVRLGVKWGSKSSPVSASLIKTDPSRCEIETNSASFNLELRCPIRYTGWKKFRIRRWWAGQYTDYSASFVYLSQSNCEISFEVNQISLDIPCPISGFTGKQLKFNQLTFGTPQVVQKQYMNMYNCGIEANNVTEFSLNVPCAIKKSMLTFETSAETTSGSTGTLTITQDTNATDGNCSRTVKIKAVFPRGGATLDSCSVIKEMRYYASKHAFQIKTINLKTKVVSGWKDVFTAVNHRSDHVNCNDV